MSMMHFDAGRLARLMARALTDRQVDPVSAGHVVASLIQTSLRGVDSHGIDLFPHYCRAAEVGRVNGRPHMRLTACGEAVATLDADHGFGHHAGAVAIQKAVELAKKTGMGSVSVRHSTHFGAAAYFGLMAPEADCLGFAFTNADALVKVFGAREPFFGTNPICFTAPMATEAPFCLDMATSLVSWNKIKIYRRKGVELPPGWAFDEAGNGVLDPDRARCLNPAGGYKGYGLGMMVDVLCGLLAGGLVSKDIKPMYAPPLDASKRSISHFFMAIDIARFLDPELFKRNLQAVADRLRSLEPLSEEQPVMVAGDPEKKTLALRSVSGLPIDAVKFEEFLEVSADFREAVLP